MLAGVRQWCTQGCVEGCIPTMVYRVHGREVLYPPGYPGYTQGDYTLRCVYPAMPPCVYTPPCVCTPLYVYVLHINDTFSQELERE